MQSGGVKRNVAERPSQDPISRILGLEASTNGIKDVQRGMFPENQSRVSVNLYSFVLMFDAIVIESYKFASKFVHFLGAFLVLAMLSH